MRGARGVAALPWVFCVLAGVGGLLAFACAPAVESAAGASGPSGAGGFAGAACATDADCPPPAADCEVVSCAAGACGVALAPKGTPAATQLPGSCARVTCDGKGGVVSEVDDANTPQGSDPCRVGTCAKGAPGTANAADGTPCAMTGFRCLAGACVACLADADCGAGTICRSNVCLPAECLDGVKNGAETGVDCGGGVCLGCADGGPCGKAADCASGVCAAGACVGATCKDGVQNAAETDVDCGGGVCPGCAGGAPCATGKDCQSGVCTAGACSAGACNDGVKNGGESGVDCGGAACPKCPVGGACGAASDCQSGVCDQGVCAPPAATCADAKKNGGETDVDCGGAACSACLVGAACAKGSDCQSGSCAGGACAAPTCVDGVKNGAETAADCGGGACPGCPAGAACAKNTDCKDGLCKAKACAAASCGDGQKNGAETGVDCGGGACPGCPVGSACAAASDCASGRCAGGACAACGGDGEPCCPGNACGPANDRCIENTTTLWGGDKHVCACGKLRPGQILKVGDSLFSCDGRFLLAMQGDGNLVLYWAGMTSLWSTDTANTPANLATFQDDGNFVVYGPNGYLWATNTQVKGGYLRVQDDGNLVIYDANDVSVWQTDTCCH